MKTNITVLGAMFLSTGVYGTNCVEDDAFNIEIERRPNVLIHTHTISYPKGSSNSSRTSPVMMEHHKKMQAMFPNLTTYLFVGNTLTQSSEQK